MSKDRAILLALLALVVYTVSFIVFNLIVAGFLADESASLLSSYSVITTATAFVAYFFGFLYTTTVAVIGTFDAQKNWEAVGKFIQWSLILGAVCGAIASAVLVVLSDEIVDLFNPEDELDNGTAFALKVESGGFFIGLVGSSLTGIFIGLVHIITLAVLSFGLGIIYVIVSLTLFFSGNGLVSFPIGTIAGKAFYSIAGLFVVFFSSRYKRYGIKFSKLSDFSKSADLTWRYFKTAFGYTTIRSFITNTRFLISILLAVRLGVVEGAVFTLVDKLSAVTYNISRQVGNLVILLIARVSGSALSEETGSPAGIEAIQTSGRLATRFGNVYGFIILGYFTLYGRNVLLNNANDDELESWESVFGQSEFYLLLVVQPLHSISSIYESLFVGLHKFKMVALITLVPFITLYLPCALFGYLKEESLFYILLADVLYFGSRTIVCLYYWYYCLSPKYVATADEETSTNSCCSKLCKYLLGSYPSAFRRVYQEFVQHWDITFKDTDIDDNSLATTRTSEDKDHKLNIEQNL
mmetsp:Transcript_16210/g.19690  ORF Transcript_16210/g.19690 Transcript_16210/m.19690 type:complete len:525 (+) Transcript_16210:394-1968(+)